MSTIYVICNNLLDASRIKESLLGKDVVVIRNIDKLKTVSIEENDTVLLDYYIYENIGINNIFETLSKCKNIISFVPHEKIELLKPDAADIIFVARSRFFHDIAKYIVI